jgi:hypothetical protein|tara:strand:+ start:175 stop:1680 length:1506 start_codon:yes stop_codon:yes gene_type:complete
MGTTSATPQFHTILNQEIEHMGGLILPVLYLNTEEGIRRMESLIGYFISHADKSTSWHKTRARGVGLFYDFCQSVANKTYFQGEDPHRVIFRRFYRSLIMGTIDTKTGLDPTKLFWPPNSIKVANRMCSAITEFIRYLDSEGIGTNNFLKTSHSTIPNNEPASLKFLYRAIIIKNSSFLAHTVDVNKQAKKIRDREHRAIVNFNSSTNTNHSDVEVKRFPSELVAPFFEYGFIIDEKSEIPHEREDITAKMMSLILFFGGTRISEPLHLWFNDVLPDYSESGLCNVYLRHPSDAKTYIAGENKLRSQYLAERGLLPRTKGTTKSYKAGWKNLQTDKALTAPVFFMHSNAQYLFNQMYIYYMEQYRPPLMEINGNLGKPDHPFLLVSSGIDQATGESYEGSPYSLKAYSNAFKRALNRVEKALNIVIPRGLEYGTVPHGPRHFYGGTLCDIGIKEKIVQKCLRHRSILSQGTYTAPTFEGIQKSLNDAKKDIDSNMQSLLTL